MEIADYGKRFRSGISLLLRHLLPLHQYLHKNPNYCSHSLGVASPLPLQPDRYCPMPLLPPHNHRHQHLLHPLLHLLPHHKINLYFILHEITVVLLITSPHQIKLLQTHTHTHILTRTHNIITIHPIIILLHHHIIITHKHLMLIVVVVLVMILLPLIYQHRLLSTLNYQLQVSHCNN